MFFVQGRVEDRNKGVLLILFLKVWVFRRLEKILGMVKMFRFNEKEVYFFILIGGREMDFFREMDFVFCFLEEVWVLERKQIW